MKRKIFCQIKLCERPNKARGLCKVHYSEYRISPNFEKKPKISQEERFWLKVEKTETCWNWTAHKTAGYGKFNYKGKTWLAHRLSLVFAGHVLKPIHVVDHLCLNKACINPAHLEQVYTDENTRRAWLLKNSLAKSNIS